MFITIGLGHDVCAEGAGSRSTLAAAVFVRRIAGALLATPRKKHGHDERQFQEAAEEVRQALNCELFARRCLHDLN